jgi:hypothetical protein
MKGNRIIYAHKWLVCTVEKQTITMGMNQQMMGIAKSIHARSYRDARHLEILRQLAATMGG